MIPVVFDTRSTVHLVAVYGAAGISLVDVGFTAYAFGWVESAVELAYVCLTDLVFGHGECGSRSGGGLQSCYS